MIVKLAFPLLSKVPKYGIIQAFYSGFQFLDQLYIRKVFNVLQALYVYLKLKNNLKKAKLKNTPV